MSDGCRKLKFLNTLVQSIQRSKKTLLLIIIVSSLTLLFSSLISIWLSNFHNLRFPSLGTIRVVGVDAYGGDISVAQDGGRYLDWGVVYPGSPVTRSFYLKSKSNTLVTLTLSISSVTFKNSREENVTKVPPVEKPLSLTWNYDGRRLSPNEEIFVTLTLKVSSDLNFLEYVINNDVQKFLFNIVIMASPLD